MTSRSTAATGLAVAGAAAAAVVGFFAVEDPATVLPLTLELVLLLLLTWVFVGRADDEETRAWLGKLVVAAILIRLSAVFLAHEVVGAQFFAPDQAGYARTGSQLADFWRGVGQQPNLDRVGHVVYVYVNAFFDYAFGDPTYGSVVLNLFAGVWTALLTYAIGRETISEKVGRVAAVLVTVFPSLVLWSVLNVRDSLSTFAVAAAVYFGLRVYRGGRLREFVGIILVILFLSGLRDYMGFLVLAGLVLGAVSVLRPGRVGRTLVVGTFLVLFLVLGLEQLGLFQRVTIENPLDTANQLRQGLQQDFRGGMAGSVYGVGYETDTVVGTLRFLPVGFTYFLFAPFPWAIDSMLQLLSLPEVLFWYFLVPFTVVGSWQGLKKARVQIWVVVAVLAVITTSYALVEGNIGTAYRHRSQIMPLVFVFTAVGLMRFWEGQRARFRRKRPQRRYGPAPSGSDSRIGIRGR